MKINLKCWKSSASIINTLLALFSWMMKNQLVWLIIICQIRQVFDELIFSVLSTVDSKPTWLICWFMLGLFQKTPWRDTYKIMLSNKCLFLDRPFSNIHNDSCLTVNIRDSRVNCVNTTPQSQRSWIWPPIKNQNVYSIRICMRRRPVLYRNETYVGIRLV